MVFEWIMTKIDKCSFCSREAKYNLYARGFMTIKNRTLCEKHKNEFMANKRVQ